ncbi:protein of unknown function DUF324 [Rhodomicrobium vannielii ATCC 17100]|uniref:CRISPR type III-associated protein domain-containing protein n=1 Tax=Rhodomicrobium vannielii (strain ATCC 17100 / DSM 162 / LMG 4299 / NCIMB 10020 / ATH 3.1.1) TaxID=648757 RepID=E3I083_RHOVT|nr:RAMP superfamily CRISPR-associated protein [Rhodomicrobium vannielii]ADP71118.1 protein of unknown function DUF324 [Rhodomicrobium vannielii ATCC 17100]
MTLQFSLSIEMISDWHIGSGQGRHGSIDRLIDRDRDDLPYIPAATVRGIWRDSAQLLARGLDDGVEDGPWSKLADRLFGSEPVLTPKRQDAPTPSLLTVDDARFPASLRAEFADASGDSATRAAGKKVLRQALTFIKPGVSIDPRSGTAKEDFLRFEEVARGGAVLEAKGIVDCPDADMRVVAAFLLGAAAMIERLGGKRRRGLGRCAVKLSFSNAGLPADATGAAAILGASDAPSLPNASNSGVEQRAFGSVQSGDWQKIPLRLKLLAPLVAADDVRGNVITCRDYIPSALLLAPIASRLAAAGLANIWTLIANGDVRILAATPEIDGGRGLPVPLCWEEEKAKKGEGVYRQIPRTASGENAQYVPIRAGFVGASEFHLRSVPKVIRTHNTIEDERQRPDETVGGVYTYEALAPGLTFRSEVWIRGGAVDSAALSGTVRLGRARQAGYGVVEIEPLGAASGASERKTRDGYVTIWLTSDAILPSVELDGGLKAIASAVARLLGSRADALFDLEGSWANLRWKRIDGWQSRWNLPRPTLVALQAGSVAELKLAKGVTIDAAKVEALEREGIGARKGEGFGCLLVNHAHLVNESSDMRQEKAKPGSFEDGNQPAGKREKDPQQEKYLNRIHRVAWERCIALRAEMAVSSEDARKELLGWTGAKPSMSQLGGLRAAMGTLTEKDIEFLQDWLKRLRDSKKWDGKAMDSLEELLKRTCEKTWPHEKIWQNLGLQGLDDERFLGAPRPATDGFDSTTHPELARFAVRTFILEAMRAHKRHGEKNGTADQDGATNNTNQEAA